MIVSMPMPDFYNTIFVAAVRSQNPLEDTVERIGGAIKSRLLSPGDRLPPERELAAQLRVSRSTLRVALQHLVDAGWLEVRRGRHGGSFVARWPLMPLPCHLSDIITNHRAQLPGLLDYRRAVESAAAAFAAERATPADLVDLEHCVCATDGQEHSFEVYRAADARFHIGIARAAYSPRLLQAVTEVQAAMTEVLDALVYQSYEVLAQSTACHWRIFESIRDGKAEAARNLMMMHVMATESIIYSLLPNAGGCDEVHTLQRRAEARN